MLRVPKTFWLALEQLVASSTLKIDRPRNTPHPKFPELIYPHDYGYLEGTTAGDGQGIDVWLGTAKEVGVTGICCTVDIFKRDAELKVLLDCSAEDARQIDDFLNLSAELPCIVILRSV